MNAVVITPERAPMSPCIEAHNAYLQAALQQ